MEELIFAGNKYISSKRASKITGYTTDYIGQMCRGEKLDCRLVGRNWYINEKDIVVHKKNFKKEQSINLNNNFNKESLGYRKIDFEPMYYSYDNRDTKLNINKFIQKQEVESASKQKEQDRAYNKDTVPIKIVRQNKPIKIYQDRTIMPAIKQSIVKKHALAPQVSRFALQKRSLGLSLAKITIGVAFLLFIAFTTGTIILEQKLSYVSSDKDVFKITLQVANIATWFK